MMSKLTHQIVKADAMANQAKQPSHPPRRFFPPPRWWWFGGWLPAAITMCCSTARVQADSPRVWSDQPAFTCLFENQKQQPATSDLYDGVWEGDSVPQLPRVPHPSPSVKRWVTAEGADYLDEETSAATKGKYSNPVRLWEGEPYPIGNGRIAASVFNGSGRDRYALNEVSFWSGGRNGGVINKQGDKGYDYGRPDIGENGFGGYQPVGDLIVDFNAPVRSNSFVREILLDKNVVHSAGVRQGVTIESTAFCCYPDQVMVLHYRAADKKKFSAMLSFATQRGPDAVAIEPQALTLTCELKNGMRCQAKAVVTAQGGTVSSKTGFIALEGVDSFTVVIAIETNYEIDFQKGWRGEQPETKIARRLDAVKRRSFDDLFKTHRRDYEALFGKAQLHLGKSSAEQNALPVPRRLEAYRKNPNDPGLEETLFNFGRYLMIDADVADHFLSVQRAGAAHGVGLDVLIEILVRIELRAVAGQKVNAQDIAMAFEPAGRGFGHMHRMAVDDQENFPPVLAQQPAQESQKDDGGETLLEDHELQLPAVGDGRNDVAAKPLSRAQNHRRLALRTEGAAGGMIGSKSHLVRPENQRFLPAGQSPNGRILSPPPGGHGLRILLESAARGLLRGKTPTCQQPPRRPNRKPHAKALGDQMNHRLAGPKIKRQLQLVRATVGDEAANGLLLPGLEPASCRTPPLPRAQPLPSLRLLPVDPAMNGLAGHSENPGHLRLGTSRAKGVHGLEADGFLRGGCQRPKILTQHAQKTT
jgi:hypothetical protein